MRSFVIAIDGPAASGKSSTASAVARALGACHIDSGSLYRALTWIAVRDRTMDPVAILDAAMALHVGLPPASGSVKLHIDGVDDVESAIRSAAVNAAVSAVSALPALRAWVTATLRDAVAQCGRAVVDGRDIGTVVCPDAQLKVYLTASAEARARRRLRQQDAGAEDPALLAAETRRLSQRDGFDSGRAVSPLRQAADAVMLDTTNLGFADQVTRIVEMARAGGMPA